MLIFVPYLYIRYGSDKMVKQEMVVEIAKSKPKYPEGFESYINEKVEKNGEGGRPHFLAVMAKLRDPIDVVLDILELCWLKNKPVGRVARKFSTGYHTIYRLLQDLEPFREELINILKTVPRRKRFWIRPFDSDYETVKAYLTHAKEDELKAYKDFMTLAEKAWRALGYGDPKNWTKSQVLDFLNELSDGSQSSYFDGIRTVAPQFRDKLNPNYMQVTRFRVKLKRRKRAIFASELVMIHEALNAMEMVYEKLIFDLHVTGAFREGARNPKSGIVGISFDRFKKKFTLVDDYESKGKTGFEMWWRNCPVDLFFANLPHRIRAYWKKRGKPTSEKVIEGGYSELTTIYKNIRKALAEYWEGKADPDIISEFSQLKPHDADKIHCNLCWEAGIPLEVVAGQDLGGGEGLGLVGRGWKSTDIIKKHYLSLTQRSDRYKKMLKEVREYSAQFNGGVHKEAD